MTVSQDRVEAFARYHAAHQSAFDGSAETADTAGLSLRTFRGWGLGASANVDVIDTFVVFPNTAATYGDWFERESSHALVWTARATEGREPFDNPSTGAFDEIDERQPEHEKARSLISEIRRDQKLPFAKQLAGRLAKLDDLAGDEDDQAKISADSLRTCIRFLHSWPNVAEPGVVLTPTGYVRAEWRAGPNRLCGVEFLPDAKVRFVVFAPDIEEPDKTIRVSGIAPVDSLFRVIEPFRISGWMER